MRQTTIIEFNGFAGSGKTTVSEKIIQSLREKGFIVADWKVILQIKNGKNIWKKELLKRLFKIPLKSLYLYGRLFLAVKPFKLKSAKPIPLILLMEVCYKELLKRNNYDFIIMDQGIIQAIISVIHTGHMEKATIFDKIVCNSILKSDQVKIINCVADEKTAVERIYKRTTMNSRLDRIQDEKELLQVLMGQQREFANLRNAVLGQKKQGIHQLDMQDAVEYNMEKLIKTILDMRQ